MMRSEVFFRVRFKTKGDASMVRKILLAAALCGSFFCAGAGEPEEDLRFLLEQVDFVLFILEGNTIRMERYGLHELNDDVNYLSKKLSKEHCQFNLSLTGEDFRAHSIVWDDESDVRLKITSGKRREQSMYYLLLSKLFSPYVDMENLPFICFDCVVNHVEGNDTKDASVLFSSKSQSKSLVDVIVPFGDGHLSTQLILDGVVRSVCGFFVQHDVFEQDLLLSGKVKKEQAFADGILVIASSEEKSGELDPEEVQDLLENKGKQAGTFFGKCKAGLFASIIKMKKLINCSWAKVLACFGR